MNSAYTNDSVAALGSSSSFIESGNHSTNSNHSTHSNPASRSNQSDHSNHLSDDQLAFDNAQKPSKSWLTILPKLLRGVGALAVVVSLYTFLAKGWDASGDLVRYFVFLGHTIALAGIGLVNAKVIKETKGARLLLMLALVSVPMIFAILGGFIFSGVSSTSLVDYPQYVTWSIGSLDSALWVSAASALLLAPVILLGFMVLVRQVSTKASLFFLLSNALLLLPFRQPELVALIAVIAATCLIFFYQVTSSKALALKTVEGKVAMGIQFLPILILLTRSFWLYQFDTVLVGCTALISFLAIRLMAKSLAETSLLRLSGELVSTILAMVTGITIGVSLLSLNLPIEIIIVLSTFIITAMIFELSLRGERRAESYRIISAVVMVGGLLLSYMLMGSLMSSLLLLVTGAGMLVASFVYQQKGLLIGGLILIGVGLYHQLAQLVIGFEFNYWIALAVVGISLIVSGSYLEANASRIKKWLANNKNKIAEWQY